MHVEEPRECASLMEKAPPSSLLGNGLDNIIIIIVLDARFLHLRVQLPKTRQRQRPEKETKSSSHIFSFQRAFCLASSIRGFKKFFLTPAAAGGFIHCLRRESQSETVAQFGWSLFREGGIRVLAPTFSSYCFLCYFGKTLGTKMGQSCCQCFCQFRFGQFTGRTSY